MTANNLPISQQFDAFELESKGIREFYKLEFLDGEEFTMYLSPHNEYDWLDHTWNFLACKISESAQNSTGEQSRPKFSIVNPNGLFSTLIEQGKTDGALVTRYRILLSDLEAGVNAYVKHIWVLSKVVSLNKDSAIFELRSSMDGAFFDLPARSFYPPDFPTVSLR